MQKQKEIQMMYRKRMERTQDYLRYCLQVAQDNGFLNLIIHNNKDQTNTIMNAVTTADTTSPQYFPAPDLHSQHHQHHSLLSSVVIQANLSGWHIAPHEVSSTQLYIFTNFFSSQLIMEYKVMWQLSIG